MKRNRIQKLSPLALGTVLCAYQVVQATAAYSVSLGSTNAAELLTPVVPEVPTATAGLADCGLPATGAGSVQSVVTPSSSTGSAANISLFAATATSSVTSSAAIANPSEFVVPGGTASNSSLVAQLPADDCCEIGGTTTCEVGGLPPQGGAALSPLSPLLGLLGLPLIAIPFIPGDDNPPPVSEPTSTAALAAGMGLLGLWAGRRRFRSASSKVSL